MPRVKVMLEPGETQEQAEESLFKAMSMHRDGGAHESEDFLDAAMQDQAAVMNRVYEMFFDKMLGEINDVIDEEG
jgi:hypothetical protein